MLFAAALLRNRYLKSLFLITILLANVMLTSAATLICRSDPVIILSNGMVMDITADITTLLINVQEVHYTLHVPRGVRAVLVVHTPTWITSRETFTVIDDQEPGQYMTTAIARTRTGRAQVILNAILLSVDGLRLDFRSARGVEREVIMLDLSE